MSQWKTIESAPTHGTEILGWRIDCGVILVRYTCCADFCTESEVEAMTDDEAFQYDWFYADFVSGGRLEGNEIPTHWMPLPEPPQ